MKAITIGEAQKQLAHLIAEACRGETIVLTDGKNQVTLYPHPILDLEEDSPELEAELMKAADSPVAPFRESELQEIADKALREYRAKRAK